MSFDTGVVSSCGDNHAFHQKHINSLQLKKVPIQSTFEPVFPGLDLLLHVADNLNTSIGTDRVFSGRVLSSPRTVIGSLHRIVHRAITY